MHQASFYEKLPESRVRCGLCNHHCVIADKKYGICGVRQNVGGELYSLNYGKLIAQHVDPVEKKPLYHVLPGSLTYSIATHGCNFRCLHCQNHTISQVDRYDGSNYATVKPDHVIDQARLLGCFSVSYTYVEPTIFFEYAYDCSVLAHESGLKNFFVSNGYMTPAVIQQLAPVLDGINIDIKGFSESFYHKVAGARLKPVLEAVEMFAGLGVWVEITSLLIEGVNDDEDELEGIADFIASVSPDIPWHITAFHPAYKMISIPPTSKETLERARRIGQEAGLNHVYNGNIIGDGEETICSGCGEVVIKRRGFSLMFDKLENGCCPNCKSAVAGVWK